MYNIVICDDDKIFIQFIKKLILSCGLSKNEVLFYEFFSGEDFIQSNAYAKIDLLILDMQMKEMDGNDTAIKFRKKFPFSMLVFCSGICRPTVKSFETMPFRYLLKEYSDIRMSKEMKIIIEELKNKKQTPYILGKRHYNIVKLTPEEILYISIAKRGSKIYLCPKVARYDFENDIVCDKKLSELYLTLKEYGFEYAHNSYIVNLNYVKRKTLTEIEMLEGTVLSVARSKEKELRQALAINLSSKY